MGIESAEVCESADLGENQITSQVLAIEKLIVESWDGTAGCSEGSPLGRNLRSGSRNIRSFFQR
jgi:hypothetical protein